jgi:adenine-specific DNA methylase
MRTEKPGRMRENDSNALASSIFLVCRKRVTDAPTVTRREFVTALKAISVREALAYNGLVQSWPEIARLSREGGKPSTEQTGLFGGTEA